EVKVWDPETGGEVRTLRRGVGIFLRMAFSPDGRRIALTHGDMRPNTPPGEIAIWDVETGRDVFTLSGHATHVTALAFSPDGRRLASGGTDRTVKLWDLETGAE